MSPEEYREFLKTVKPGSSPLPKSQLLHEVKGHWEDDARVKIKVAATQHPWFRFLAVKAGKTGWQYETFGGGA